MALPEDLKGPISEIKTPAVKILIIVLILAIMSETGGLVYVSQTGDKDLQNEIKTLRAEKQRDDDSCYAQRQRDEAYKERQQAYINAEAQDDIKQWRDREKKMDSIVSRTNRLISNR